MRYRKAASTSSSSCRSAQKSGPEASTTAQSAPMKVAFVHRRFTFLSAACDTSVRCPARTDHDTAAKLLAVRRGVLLVIGVAEIHAAQGNLQGAGYVPAQTC